MSSFYLESFTTLTSVRGVHDHLFGGRTRAHVVEGLDDDKVGGRLLQSVQHELLALPARVGLERAETEGAFRVHLLVAHVVPFQGHGPVGPGRTLQWKRDSGERNVTMM